MSKKDFGGHIYVRTSEGDRISLRGTLTIDPTTVSIEAITNQDGSGDRVAAVKMPTAEISFADRGKDYDAILKAPRQNFTFEEEFTDVTFFFTDGFFTGSPQINRLNGEVTGIGITAEKIRRRG
jgi:hypothetical protein